MCPPVFSFVDVPQGLGRLGGTGEASDHGFLPFTTNPPVEPVEPPRRLSCRQFQLRRSDLLVCHSLDRVVSRGRPDGDDVTSPGSGPATSASARPGPPPSACNPDRPAGFRPAGPCTC